MFLHCTALLHHHLDDPRTAVGQGLLTQVETGTGGGLRAEAVAGGGVVAHAVAEGLATSGGGVLLKVLDARDEPFDIGYLDRVDAAVGGRDALDGAVVVEREAVDTHLAVVARTVAEVGGIDAVVDQIPVVGAGDADHGAVAGAIDQLVGILQDDDGLARHADGACGGGRGAVGHVVVGGAGVVDRPEEVVDAVAEEHVGTLAEGVVGERAAGGGDDVLGVVDGEHVVGEQAVAELAIAVVEVGLAGEGVGEDVGINHLAGSRGGEEGFRRGAEGSGGTFADGHAERLLAVGGVLAAEVEVVVPLAIRELLLDAGCPGVARGPGHVLASLQREDGALVGEMEQVGRGEDVERIATPGGIAVGGGIEVEAACLLGEEHLGVGMEVGQHGVADRLYDDVVGSAGMGGEGIAASSIELWTPGEVAWSLGIDDVGG